MTKTFCDKCGNEAQLNTRVVFTKTKNTMEKTAEFYIELCSQCNNIFNAND